MAAGASLREGYFKEGHLSDDEMWSAFSFLFSSKSKNSASFKYCFHKAILDNLFNTDENLVLTFDQLFSKFDEIHSKLAIKHHVRLGLANVTIEKIVLSAKQLCYL